MFAVPSSEMHPSEATIDANVNVGIVEHKNDLTRLVVFFKCTNSGRIYSHIAVWLALLFVLVIPGGSTTIIAVMFNDAVVIVADSKEVNVLNGQASSVCKIHFRKQFAWAVSGPVKAMGYSINSTINRTAVTNEAFRIKVTKLDEGMADVIRDAANKLKKQSPAAFEQFINSSEILEFLYVGIENGKMAMCFRQYKIELVRGRVNVNWTWNRDCPGKNCRDPQMSVMGERRAVETYIIAHPGILFPSTIEAALQTGRMFVNMEAIAAPEVVALPINTAVIDSQGVRWGPDNQQCRDTHKAGKPAAKPH